MKVQIAARLDRALYDRIQATAARHHLSFTAALHLLLSQVPENQNTEVNS